MKPSALEQTERVSGKKNNLQKPRQVASQSRWLTFFFPLPPAFFAPRTPAFFSGVKSCRRMRSVSDQGPIGSCVCVCGSTWSLFLPESESDGVGSDSDGDPLSASRSLEEPPRTFFGGGGRWNERGTGNIFKGQLFISNQVFGPDKVTLIVTYYRHS